MRQLGIVKWFGNNGNPFNNNKSIDYGFISIKGSEDLYVHKIDLLCSPSQLFEGVIVTFNVTPGRKQGKLQASQVNLLKDELNWEIVETCASSDDFNFWREVWPRYVATLSTSEGVAQTLVKLNSILRKIDPFNKTMFDISEFVSALPTELMKISQDLRAFLPEFARLHLLAEMFQEAPQDFRRDLAEEFHAAISKSDQPSFEGIFSYNIYQQFPDLRKSLSITMFSGFLVEWIKIADEPEISNLISEWKKILDISLNDRELSSTLWKKIPLQLTRLIQAELIKKPALRESLPLKDHVEFIVKAFNEHIDENQLAFLVNEWLEKATKNGVTGAYTLEPLWRKLPIQSQALIERRLAEEYIRSVRSLSYRSSSSSRANDIVKRYPDIRIGLPFGTYVPAMKELIQSEESKETRKDLLAELASAIQMERAKGAGNIKLYHQIWADLPDDLIVTDELRSLAPLKRLNKAFAWKINNVWTTIIARPKQVWKELEYDMKYLVLFKAVKEEENIQFPLPEVEEDLLIQALLYLYHSVTGEFEKQFAFNQFHSSFERYIIDIAWDSTAKLRIPFLTLCSSSDTSKVYYCEGRQRSEVEINRNAYNKDTAFCPRLYDACEYFKVGAPHRTMKGWGARIDPEYNIEWWDWSLLEYIFYIGIEPRVNGLRSPYDYVPKLSGWVNRLNEIRGHLKCRYDSCGCIMRPNHAYARFLARFNMTIVSCEHGFPHDENIYLNECWGCHMRRITKIIDGRDDKYQVGGFYVCLKCGSGPLNHAEYTQGDLCPQCGSSPMVTQVSDNTKQQCHFCNHEITLPPIEYRTGKLCESCVTGRLMLIGETKQLYIRQCVRCKVKKEFKKYF